MNRRDLDHPLCGAAPRKPLGRFNLAPVVISAAVLVALIAATWVAVVDDPDGGQPVATALIEDAPSATGSITAAPSAATPDEPAASSGPPINGGSDLLEPSPFGMLPRVAPDGRRPRDVYARKIQTAAAGAPRIALIVGGLGISQTGTQRAIEALPETVTLAFAPYGSSLQRWVDKARERGHEILLQIPLEPEGEPDQSPGEHTLIALADRQANESDLRWNLGRMTSYAGVMNYMGGRFTSDERALASLLGEIGERGLFYVDDGSSSQSRAVAVGTTLQVPVVAADLVVDRDRSLSAIGAKLEALEALARSRGSAVGVATAFPATVDALAAWAKAAPGRGIVIVPASAMPAQPDVAAR